MDSLIKGFIELKKQHFQESAENFSFCLSFNQIPDPQKILVQHIMGLMYYNIGNVHMGKYFLFQAVKLEKKNGLKQESMHTSHMTALLEHVKGNIRRANEYYLTTLSHMKKTHELESMTLCLRTLGEFALFSGDIDKARMLWEKGLIVAEKAELPAEILTQEWLHIMQHAFPKE